MITGFKATMEVNDGTAGASVKFSGLTTFNVPSLEAGKFDATELDQADPHERESPTGLIKVGVTKAEMKYTKANYTRLKALLGVKGKTFILSAPDDQTDDEPVVLDVEFTGFVNKLDEIKFEKDKPVAIPFEVTVQSGGLDAS